MERKECEEEEGMMLSLSLSGAGDYRRILMKERKNLLLHPKSIVVLGYKL